jgi:hypothetical protein
MTYKITFINDCVPLDLVCDLSLLPAKDDFVYDGKKEYKVEHRVFDYSGNHADIRVQLAEIP